MLEARGLGGWRDSYDLIADGQAVATWDPTFWRAGGNFYLAGRRYDVKSNVWGTRFEMIDEVGVIVGAADRVRRKRWTLEAGGRTYQFQRASWGRSEELFLADGRPAGSVRRVSAYESDVVADLPGLPLLLQIFVIVVLMTKWDAPAA
jgi:hypothetical protein